jgi:hypothetical protein
VKKRLLLAFQRIEVQALIQAHALNTRAFHWSVRESETTRGTQVTRLEYGSAGSPAFFQFDCFLRQYYAVYSWGATAEREEHFTGHWPSQAAHVARWLGRLMALNPA